MNRLLDLSDEEREFKIYCYAIGYDEEGLELLVGLSREESEWYVEYQKKKFPPKGNERIYTNQEEDRRFLNLHEKHELERFTLFDPQRKNPS